MRTLLCALIFAAGLHSAVFTSKATGNANATGQTTWNEVGAPTAGDTYVVNSPHVVTVNAPTQIGQAAAASAAKTGTIADAATTTVTGTGTLFTTELLVGDTLNWGAAFSRTVIGITDDTHLTLASSPGTITAGTSYTARRYGIWVKNGGTLAIAPGIPLTLNGDLNLGGAFTMGAGSSLLLNSAAYRVWLGAGDLTPGVITTTGATCLSGRDDLACPTYHATISADTNAFIADAGGSSAYGNVSFTRTDFIGLGSASVMSVSSHPVAAGKNFNFDHCTFTNSGAIGNAAAVTLAGNVAITNNRLISLPAGVSTLYTFINLAMTAGTSSGTRTFNGNVFNLPDHDVTVNFGSSCQGFTMQNNVVDRVGCANNSFFTDFSNNLFVVRQKDAFTEWSFLGDAGTTLHDNYFLDDEGEGQANDHQVMSNDAVTGTGNWKMTNYIFERSSQAKMQFIHPDGADGSGATGTVLFQYDHMLELPNPVGRSPGAINFRGGNFSTVEMTHNTLMTDPTDTGVAGVAGATAVGSLFAGHSSMFTKIQNNLAWQAAARSGTQTFGYLFAMAGTPATYAADSIVAAAAINNAYWNATTGTMYDAAGANGTSAVGWHGFKQTIKPTFAKDVVLDASGGPRYLDPTRNIETFDSAYLGNTATAWVDGHAYSVGDIVSASTSTWYNGVTINYRCVKAHTSAVANATNGMPGSAVTLVNAAPVTGYRINWEFETVDRMRTATPAGTLDPTGRCPGCTYIQALSAWVRAGFAPTNLALKGTASDGTDIGAVPITRWAAPGGIGTGGVAY